MLISVVSLPFVNDINGIIKYMSFTNRLDDTKLYWVIISNINSRNTKYFWNVTMTKVFFKMANFGNYMAILEYLCWL